MPYEEDIPRGSYDREPVREPLGTTDRKKAYTITRYENVAGVGVAKFTRTRALK